MEARLPDHVDTEWMPSHAAFYYAQEQGKGLEYTKTAFACRFQRDLSLGEDEVLGGIAEEVGLDPLALLAACNRPACGRGGASAAPPGGPSTPALAWDIATGHAWPFADVPTAPRSDFSRPGRIASPIPRDAVCIIRELTRRSRS